LRPRIFGAETEYAFHYWTPGERAERWEEEELARHFEEGAALIGDAARETVGPAAGEFLGNGGRFYLDRGGHPEYATPECRNVFDLVAHEKAGDRLMLKIAHSVQARLEREGRAERVSVFKNNADSHGNTYGSHENYLVTPRVSRRLNALLPFLVTRQIFAGSGKVSEPLRGEAPAYQVSQRADFFDCVSSDRASGVRGIINTRKREIHQPGQNRRLHVIVGDSNLSESAIALKWGSTCLVLRLLEEGRVDGLPVLASPVGALKSVSQSPERSLETVGKGPGWTALRVQSAYLERVQRTFGPGQLDPEEARMLELWATALAGLSRLRFNMEEVRLEEDPEDVRRKVDWVLKLWILSREARRGGGGPEGSRRRLMDLRYHDLDPRRSIFARCQTLGLVDRLVEERAIERALAEPPSDTRAWTRGRLIREMVEREVEVRVSTWDRLRIGGAGRATERTPFFASRGRRAPPVDVKLDDPFSAVDPAGRPEVRAFLATWEAGRTDV
jgi:proteasome accessory factor A